MCCTSGMTPDQLRRVSEMRKLAASGTARTMREEQRLSLHELAVLVNTTPSTLSRWERGIARPRAGAALNWASALQLVAA